MDTAAIEPSGLTATCDDSLPGKKSSPTEPNKLNDPLGFSLSLTPKDNSTFPFQSASGVKVQVSLLFSFKVPFPVERFRFNTDNSSPSGSVALAKRSDFLIIKLLSSSTEPRSTGPVTTGGLFSSGVSTRLKD